MFKKVVVLFLSVLLAFPFVMPVCAADKKTQAETIDVQTLDIGIRPAHYKNLVSNEAETVYPIMVKDDDSDYVGASIKNRGYSSKLSTIYLDAHRVPFEIKFSGKKDALLFENTSLKLINSYTPFRLIAEYLGLELFEYCGIPTPEHSFVFLRLNDVDFGVYLAVEDVNEEFIAKHFSNTAGLLCKSNSGKWPACFPGFRVDGKRRSKKTAPGNHPG